MLKNVNIKILIDYWRGNGLISKKDFNHFKELGRIALDTNRK